jgi:hypothetical protein
MEPIEIVLALWQEGFMSGQEVIRWADEKILSSDSPSQDIIELSLHGPSKYLKTLEWEFPSRPASLSYTECFALRAASLEVSSDSAVKDFVIWMSGACFSVDYDSNLQELTLAYYVEDLVSEYNDMDAAIAEVRKELPDLLPRCKNISKHLFEMCA